MLIGERCPACGGSGRVWIDTCTHACGYEARDENLKCANGILVEYAPITESAFALDDAMEQNATKQRKRRTKH